MSYSYNTTQSPLIYIYTSHLHQVCPNLCSYCYRLHSADRDYPRSEEEKKETWTQKEEIYFFILKKTVLKVSLTVSTEEEQTVRFVFCICALLLKMKINRYNSIIYYIYIYNESSTKDGNTRVNKSSKVQCWCENRVITTEEVIIFQCL